MSILRGETSVPEAARQARPDRGRGGGLEGEVPPGRRECAASRPKDEEALKDEQIKKLKQKVGELVLDIDILKEAMKGRPFAERTSDE